MGCRNGEAETAVELPAADSGNALLLATVSTVGLLVEVQVKDGSLYSGIFHTASVDEGYGGWTGLERGKSSGRAVGGGTGSEKGRGG
ncbi:hypothetical protein KSP39_PZI003359 [Platanthera zijinensis]|uniref:Ataxin 2 SM domain-containing protein n=1 Tax=Platanthera zijinensis TaxID=2320716 RepID=A0AAP0BW32_9ASPA